MRQLIVRLASVVVIGVFASLPTLARVHDRLSTHDDVSGYRLSKNLERPHEKLVSAAAGPRPTFRLAPPRPHRHTTFEPLVGTVVDVPVSPLASRAPPLA